MVGEGETTIVRRQCSPSEPGCELRPEIHEHADFAVLIRGKPLDFSAEQFVSTEGKELSPNVHIHAPRYSVAHIHRDGTTWEEFFRSLGFELSDMTNGAPTGSRCLTLPSKERLCESANGSLKFIVNGVLVDGVASMNMHDLTRLLISFGPESDEEAMRQFVQVGVAPI